jgi:excisionase family DNA binding protein
MVRVMENEFERLTFTATEAAVILGVSRGAVYESIRRNELRALHFGRRVVIPRTSLSAFLNGDPQ